MGNERVSVDKCPLRVGDVVRWGKYGKHNSLSGEIHGDCVIISAIYDSNDPDSDSPLVDFRSMGGHTMRRDRLRGYSYRWFLDDEGNPVYDPFLNEVAHAKNTP